MDATERRDRATAEAARWWAVLGNRSPAEVSETDRREFTIWLRESPLHIAEILRIARVDDTLRSFGSWDEIPVGTEEQADSKIIRLTPPAAADNPTPARNVNLRRRLALAAGIVAAVTVAGWFGLHTRDTVLSTDRAERREVMLADGSTVSLGPETQVRVGLSKTERHLTLERGRALFRVAKDPQRPFLVYDVCKVASEGMGRNYARMRGLQFIALRFAQIFGPGKLQRHGPYGLFSQLVESPLAGKPVKIPRGGDQRDDVIYVDDIAEAIVQAVLHPRPSYDAYNISRGVGTTLHDFADAVRKVVPNAQIEIGNGLDYHGLGACYCGIMDNTRASVDLGFRPRFDLDSGVAHYIETMRKLQLSPVAA